jgi:hypothetical protein
MYGSINSQYISKQRLALEVLAQHGPLGLGSGYQFFPHFAVFIYWGRVVDELSYCN